LRLRRACGPRGGAEHRREGCRQPAYRFEGIFEPFWSTSGTSHPFQRVVVDALRRPTSLGAIQMWRSSCQFQTRLYHVGVWCCVGCLKKGITDKRIVDDTAGSFYASFPHFLQTQASTLSMYCPQVGQFGAFMSFFAVGTPPLGSRSDMLINKAFRLLRVLQA
jgi:hypothetical protein